MKKIGSLVFFAALLGTLAFGAETKSNVVESKKASKISTEQRGKMADLHEKMASCLRSDRPLSECHQDMIKGCKDTMGKDGCPMMGGKMGHEMHHGMMEEQGAEKK